MTSVIIPCYNRPEFLQVCLEQIMKADESSENLYVFCLDFGFDKKHLQIIEQFELMKQVIEVPYLRLTLGKQSYNVLNGLIYGAQVSDLVILIEDDVFIGKDFFRWHKEVHKQELLFAAISSKCHQDVCNLESAPTNDLNDYYTLYNDYYQGIGTSFKAAIINKYIKPHFSELYFKNPIHYVAKNFPESSIGTEFAEQDGLIRRIKERTGLSTAYPHVPRCFHAGFYGKNRGKYTRLPFADKIRFIKDNCFSPEKMKKLVDNPYYYFDSEPVNLDTDFEQLKKVDIEQRF